MISNLKKKFRKCAKKVYQKRFFPLQKCSFLGEFFISTFTFILFDFKLAYFDTHFGLF